MLVALRNAHAARQQILANAQPVSVQAVKLPDQNRHPPAPSYRWRYLSCRTASFSSCGRWLAVVLEGRQRCTQMQADPPLSESITLYEVAICSASEGYQQQASFCTGSAAPIIHWSTAASHILGIAQLQHRCRQRVPPSVPAAAFTVDALTGAVLPFLCRSASALAQAVADGNKFDVEWAPDCNSLFVLGHWAATGAVGPILIGWLYVVHAHGDNCAAFTVKAGCEGADMASWPTAAWHPSSQGIVLDWNLDTEDDETFTEPGQQYIGDVIKAGFAVGHLPQPFGIDQAGFSADGQLLVAIQRPGHADPPALQRPGSQCVLSCSMQQGQLSFAIAHSLNDHPPCMDLAWLPGQAALLMGMPGGSASDSVLNLHSNQEQPLAERAWAYRELLSPSGRLLLAERARSLHILDLQTGEVRWKSSTAGPGRTPIWSLVARKQRNQRWDEDIPETDFCQAWLPSGLGFICITPGLGVAQAPSLCIVSFA